jgi:hypothetical protein
MAFAKDPSDQCTTQFSQRSSTYQNRAMKLVKAAVDDVLGFSPRHLERNAELAEIMVPRDFHVNVRLFSHCLGNHID